MCVWETNEVHEQNRGGFGFKPFEIKMFVREIKLSCSSLANTHKQPQTHTNTHTELKLESK